MGRRSFHERSDLLQQQQTHSSVPRRRFLRRPVTSRRSRPIRRPIRKIPRWENLASAIGNQYIREGKVFACNVTKGGFFYENAARAAAGHIRHFAHRDRSHQQSERDQSDLPSR